MGPSRVCDDPRKYPLGRKVISEAKRICAEAKKKGRPICCVPELLRALPRLTDKTARLESIVKQAFKMGLLPFKKKSSILILERNSGIRQKTALKMRNFLLSRTFKSFNDAYLEAKEHDAQTKKEEEKFGMKIGVDYFRKAFWEAIMSLPKKQRLKQIRKMFTDKLAVFKAEQEYLKRESKT
jgi:hypothetical protein